MESIVRKTLLYKSGLGFSCVNAAQGCGHGCRYPCYAFMMGRTYGRASSYEDWCRPRIVSNAAELLEKELSRMKRRPDRVHFSLTTDPFMVGYPEVEAMSMRLTEIANAHGVSVSILTKGTLPLELADRARFPLDNVYGISLVSLDEKFRRKWEPGAAPFAERISALRALHDRGRATLVHMEPYPTPNIIRQDLAAILTAIDFTDTVFFGGWNYNAVATGFPDRKAFYNEQRAVVRRFCADRGVCCDMAG